MELLTGGAAKRQQDQLNLQADQIGSSQRQSLARMAADQGELDQASARGGKRGRGRSLLTFLSGSGQASLG